MSAEKSDSLGGRRITCEDLLAIFLPIETSNLGKHAPDACSREITSPGLNRSVINSSSYSGAVSASSELMSNKAGRRRAFGRDVTFKPRV